MAIRSVIALAVVFVTASAALANSNVTLKDRQQAACYNDVQKLCGEFVPDTEKTEACMRKMHAKVSAACRKFYKPAE